MAKGGKRQEDLGRNSGLPAAACGRTVCLYCSQAGPSIVKRSLEVRGVSDRLLGNMTRYSSKRADSAEDTWQEASCRTSLCDETYAQVSAMTALLTVCILCIPRDAENANTTQFLSFVVVNRIVANRISYTQATAMQDKAFDAQEMAAALRAQLEEARREASEAAAGALDHANSASFQRVRTLSSALRSLRCSFRSLLSNADVPRVIQICPFCHAIASTASRVVQGRSY